MQLIINIATVCRESFIFQVQVLKPLSDTQEMEDKIKHYLRMPYNNGSVSIATENDVQICRIREYVLASNQVQKTKKSPENQPFFFSHPFSDSQV